MGRGTIKKIGAALAALLFFLSAVLPGLWALPSGPALPADADVGDVEKTPKLIALTFDDGPRRSTTPLLDGLAERGVPATFFLIGEQIPGHEDTLRRMVDEGHQLGIHSYTHVKLTGLNDADFASEVGRTRTVIQNAVGPMELLLRPPYGMVDAGVRRRAGAPIILWSIDPEDWGDRNTAREVEQILQQAEDGAIILLHDIYPESVEAALQVVDALHGEGYYFVTISQLFAARGVSLEKGQVYRHACP